MNIPKIGMGTFRLENEIAYNSVKIALEEGYRHIDTAQIYGNEAEVGQAISDSAIPRDQIFITTKVWRDNLSKEQFIPSVKESLTKLKTEYVDLLLIHWPLSDDEIPMSEYLTELAKAKDLGLTKAIGVSNFTIHQLKEAITLLGSDNIFTNQIEMHPYLQNRALISFTQSQDILVTGYMSLAVGKVLDDEVLQKIAQKHSATIPQIVLAWVLTKELITIPSSTKREHLISNLAAMKIKLSAEEISAIDKIEPGSRIANPDFAPEWDM